MTGSGTAAGRGVWRRVLATGAFLWLGLAGAADAQDSGQQPSGRGFVWGAGIGGGRLGFPGAEGKTVVVGDFTGEPVSPYGAYPIPQRVGEVQDVGVAVDARHAAGFPSSETAGGFSMHAGYAFSRRVALLLEVELAAGLRSEDFNNVMGGVVLRYWPASGVWVEAGPASGDLRYGYAGSVVSDFAGTGHGFMTAAGVSVLRRPRWTLDLQAGYGRLWYDGFQVTSLSFGLSASRLPR